MAEDFTPWENRFGRFYKREDLYEDMVFGVNGSKYRTWKALIQQAVPDFSEVVVAGSVHAPTVPIAAVAAKEAGLECTVIVGGTTPEKAMRHRYIQIAKQAGAGLEAIPVGYGPALKKAARDFEGSHDSVWRVAPPEPPQDVRPFLEPVGRQVLNMPAELRTLIIPFGSGNTAAGVLYGLSQMDHQLERVVLVGIGPDRMAWLGEMLEQAGVNTDNLWNNLQLMHIQLHDWFAKYADRMPETVDGIVMHPTYEGKAVRYLNTVEPAWWERDDSTGFWIVGGAF